jgi:hypothetical protein
MHRPYEHLCAPLSIRFDVDAVTRLADRSPHLIRDPGATTMTILEEAPAVVSDDPDPRQPSSAPVDRNATPRHEHGVRCYWDFRECRWVCVPS